MDQGAMSLKHYGNGARSRDSERLDVLLVFTLNVNFVTFNPHK